VSEKTWLKTFAPNVEHNSNTGSDEYKSECCKSHAECNNYGRDVAHGCSPTAVSSVLSLTLHNKTSHVSGNCADLIFSASSLPCHKLISSLSFRLVWLHNNGSVRILGPALPTRADAAWVLMLTSTQILQLYSRHERRCFFPRNSSAGNLN